jgi:hypothetical protein
MDLTMVEASQRLGVPRGTFYEELIHIRAIFKAIVTCPGLSVHL